MRKIRGLPPVLIIILGLMFILFQRQSLASPWKYDISPDEMGRGDIKTASVYSTNMIRLAFPYNGDQFGILLLRVHPKYGKDIQLIIPRGQFLCGIDSCRIAIRFDNGKAQNYTAVPPADHSTNALFIKGYDRFLKAVRKSKKVYIEAQFFQQGTRVFQFDVSGLEWPPISKK